MRTKTVAGAAMVVAAIAGGASAAAAAAAGPPSSTGATTGPTTGPTGTTGGGAGTTCDADAHWPAYVQGAPDGFDAGDNGVFLWHDPKGGWGLRVSHSATAAKTAKVVIAGRITSKGTISDVRKVKDEKNDKVAVVNNGHTLVFRFVERGGVDGVDFATSCTPGLRAAFRVDKTMVPAGAIHLGDHKVSPGSDPFIIRRRDTDTATTAPKHGPGSTPSAPSDSAPTAPAGGSTIPAGGSTPPSGGVA